MWIAMIVQGVIVAVVIGLVSIVVRIENWWPYAGIILLFYVGDIFALIAFRDLRHRMIAEYGISAVLLVLFLFEWINPGPPLEKAYIYASSTVKAQFADYRITDSVDYLAKNSAPAAKIFKDFPGSRGRLIATLRYDYERTKYRGKLSRWVNDHLNRFIASYARRYVATAADKAVLAYFKALAQGASYNDYQPEKQCMRYLAGHPVVREVILKNAGTDVTNRIKVAEDDVILSGTIAKQRTTAAGEEASTAARQIITDALREVAPVLKAQEKTHQRENPRRGCDIVATLAKRVQALPPDRAGPVAKHILAHFFAFDPWMRQEANRAPLW